MSAASRGGFDLVIEAVGLGRIPQASVAVIVWLCVLGIPGSLVDRVWSCVQLWLRTRAADGYARMTGKPACTLLHCGPGLANGLSNLHNARRAKSPIVNIVGDHATYHKKYNSPLTTDVEATAKPYTDWVKTAVSSDSVSFDGAKAVAEAKKLRPP